MATSHLVCLLALLSHLHLIRAAPYPEPTSAMINSISTVLPSMTGPWTLIFATSSISSNAYQNVTPSPTPSSASINPSGSIASSRFFPHSECHGYYYLNDQRETYWALPPDFPDMSPFNVTSYAAGKSNLAIIQGSPRPVNATSTSMSSSPSPSGSSTTATVTNASPSHSSESGSSASSPPWNPHPNSLRILYPNGTSSPSHRPQGGAEFYAEPLSIRTARNVSLEYSVYFPVDFDFFKGGKLPGLYGGHKGCSGGNAAVDCFSTRMMWRTNGLGELYLYVPKDKQTPALCSTPPQSVCESTYGLSIGRGSFTWAKGGWTTMRQDIWLNTPGLNDGGFNIWADGRLVMSSSEVRYREHAENCGGEEGDQGDADISAVTTTRGDLSVSLTSGSSGASSSALASATAVSLTTSMSSITSSLSSGMGITSAAMTSVVTSSAPPSVTVRAFKPSKRQDQGEVLSDPAESADGDSESTSASPEGGAAVEPEEMAIDEVMDVPVDSTAAVEVTSSSATSISSCILSSTTETTSATLSSSASSVVATGTASSATSLASMPPSASIIATTPTAISSSSSTQQTSSSVSPLPEKPVKIASAGNDCSLGFIGLFFSTFFGGHTSDWAPSADQYTYFKDFKMMINE